MTISTQMGVTRITNPCNPQAHLQHVTVIQPNTSIPPTYSTGQLHAGNQGDAPQPAEKVNSSFQLTAWSAALRSHPGTELQGISWQGIQHGFRIGLNFRTHSCQLSIIFRVPKTIHRSFQTT